MAADSPWQVTVGFFMVGVAMAGIGLASATNFRGVVELHVRKTFQIMRPLEAIMGRVPPWRREMRKPVEERIRRQIKSERLSGIFLAVAGMAMIISDSVSLVVG
jgi:hypothetical protein